MADGFWIRKDGRDQHVAVNTALNNQLVDNAGSSVQENRTLTILGYYLTVFSETSEMYVARLITAPEMIPSADITDSSPEDDDRMVYAKHYAHSGVPGYFQIKSKRNLYADDHLWISTFCRFTIADIFWSFQAYVVGSG